MEMNEFLLKLKSAKNSLVETAEVLRKSDVKVVSSNACSTIYYLRGYQRRTRFVNEEYKEVVIRFYNKPEHLTIFEAGLLFSLYALNKKPKDYASYHKCIAGKEFIANIKEVFL